MALLRRCAARASLLALLLAAPAARADGPGLPNLTYEDKDVFTVIGHLGKENGSPRGHGTLSMHRGYLTVVFSQDSGKGDGGFAFYDIADPRNPKLVFAKDDDETEDIREGHGYGFSGDLVALQATKGVQFWDWSDVTKPKLVSYLKLPGVVASDYLTGAWWVFWQAPYVYVGGTANGLFIVDASDVANPKLIDRGEGRPNPIPPANLGGFRTGPVFAVGNLLAITGAGESGYAVLDIRDPVNPLLLAGKTAGVPKIYSGLFNGGRLYGAGDGGSVHVVDVSDPFQLVDLGLSENTGGKGGYLSFQDGFALMGASQLFAKVDVTAAAPFPIVGKATSGVPGRDEDFATALGNLVAISDDHGNGSFLVPHQSAPDTTPPKVNMVNPPNGAANVPKTARVGLTFTDQIDARTIDASTITVRPVDGAPLPGRYSYQTNIVNFAPDAPLAPNTTYEIVVKKGGLHDLAGNPTDDAFVSHFSTGGAVKNPLCELAVPGPYEVGLEIPFSVKVKPPTSVFSYSWDFGDGTPPTPVSEDATAKHSFAAPGHYTVNVFVRDDDGLVTTCSLGQTVHRPLTVKKPTRSSTVLVDEEFEHVWVVNLDNESVSCFDSKTLTRLFEIQVGRRPRAIGKAKDGAVWVLIEGDARIALLAAHSGQGIGTIALPTASRPFGLALTPNGDRAYVTLQATGELVELDAITRTIQRTLPVGPTPRGVAVSADASKVLITRFLSPEDHGEVVEVDASAFAIARTITLPLDDGPDTESSGAGVLNYLRSVTISPDGVNAWVPAKKDNTGRGAFQTGKPLTFESTVRTSVATLDLVAGEEKLAARVDLNDRSLAAVAEASAHGDYVFVATEGTNTVEVLDAYSSRLVTGIEDVGKAPDGLALDAAGTTLYVHSFLSRELQAFDVSGVVTQSGAPIVEKVRARTIEADKLTPELRLGKQIFYDASDRRMSRDKYIACATCHLDGEHDGRTWDFTDRGEGLRNTTTLIGKRGAGQGRLHWTANFDEVQDFEHDIRNAFGGKGFLPDDVFHAEDRDSTLGGKKAGLNADLDALAAYLTSLERVDPSPFRNPDGSMTADARAGEAIFLRLKCDSCHGGPDFTDSAKGELHDVGTVWLGSGQRLGEALTGLDTPTLKGIWATAPYLHDGSAATLDDVLEQAAQSGKHGDVASLSAEERKQLVAYLLQLDETPAEAEAADDGGCGCRTHGESTSGAPAIAALLIAAGVIRRRRR